MAAFHYIVWMVIFTVVPMLLILGYSLIEVTDNGVIHLTLDYIRKCFEPIYLQIIAFSFYTAILCTALCLVIGYPIAIILAGDSFKHKNTLIFLLLAPMWMNFLLRTYSWLTLLERNGLINRLLTLLGLPNHSILYTTGSVMLGMVYNFLPFMILPIYSVVSKIDSNLIEAANDLGASKWNIFRKITLPMSIQGVFSGIVMVFMPAVTTFVITRLLGGGQKEMIGNVIEQQFIVSGDWSFGSALSALLMVVILVCISFSNRKGTAEKGERGALI